MHSIVNKKHLELIMKRSISLIKNLKDKINFKNKIKLQDKEILINKIREKILVLSKNKDLKKFNPLLIIQNLQDKLERLVSVNNSQVILRQSGFWVSAITWTLMGATTFGIGWIAIAKTDEVVIAVGKLEPEGGVIDVQMPLEGIAREILISEGEQVSKGQVLIRLDSEVTTAQYTALKNNLELNNNILNKLKILVEEGAVSEFQYLEKKVQIESIKSQLKTNEVTLKYQEIVSPVDGIVFELQPKGPGYVARSSQPVLKIVPLKNLIAKVEIDSRTIGFVKPGKKADISIDSFPASDFGVVEGKVLTTGSDALPPDPSQGKGYRFPAKISLDNQYLEHKSGKKLPLQTGMSISANIKLRKVTYLQLLLNQFSDKVDSLKSI